MLNSQILSGAPHVYWVDGVGIVHNLMYRSDIGTWDDIDLLKAARDAPVGQGDGAVACTTLAGDARVYYVATADNGNGRVWELAWWGNNWHARNVSVDAGGPLAISKSPLTSTTLDGNPRLYYVAAAVNGNNTVWELAWWGNQWHARNVSVDAGGPPADPGSPLTSTTLDGNPRVYYMSRAKEPDLNCNLWELAWWGGEWHSREIAKRCGGTSTRNLTSTAVGGNPRVYYWEPRPTFDMNLKIIEQAWWGDQWHELILGGGPESLTYNCAVACTTLAGNPRVYYTNDSVRELAYWGGTNWVRREVAIEGGAAGLAWGSPLTSLTLADEPRVYYLAYRQAGSQVHELAYRSNTNTWVDRTISS